MGWCSRRTGGSEHLSLLFLPLPRSLTSFSALTAHNYTVGLCWMQWQSLKDSLSLSPGYSPCVPINLPKATVRFSLVFSQITRESGHLDVPRRQVICLANPTNFTHFGSYFCTKVLQQNNTRLQLISILCSYLCWKLLTSITCVRN